MHIGCCAYSYRQYLTSGEMSLEDFIDLAAELGLDGVELTSYYFPTTEASYLHSLKRRCLVNGLDVAGVATRSRFTLASADERAEQVAMVKQWIGHAVELGAPGLRVFAGNTPEGYKDDDVFPWVVEALSDCASTAGERGVVLALENHGGVTTTADQVIRLVEAVDSEWLRVNVDTGNFMVDHDAQIARTVPYAVTAHLKAAVRTPDGKEPADIQRVLRALKGAGYKGFVNLEYEEEEDAKTAVPRLVREMKEALAKV